MKEESIENLESLALLTDDQMIRIEVPGIPIPWKAPRVGRRHTFSPHHADKNVTKCLVSSQYKRKPLEGPIFLIAYFDMPIPLSLSKRKRDGLIRTPHQTKPDCTNLQKFIEDCLTGIVYLDDKQVWRIFSEKKYSEKPKTVIYIQELCTQHQ